MQLTDTCEQYAFSVSDTGCGVAPQIRRTIFEPFVQGPQHEKQGTGLG